MNDQESKVVSKNGTLSFTDVNYECLVESGVSVEISDSTNTIKNIAATERLTTDMTDINTVGLVALVVFAVLALVLMLALIGMISGG